MEILTWSPKQGCKGKAHRRENHFKSEVAVIEKTEIGYRNPITIRVYRSAGRVSFCIWVSYGNYYGSGSAITSSSYRDETIIKMLESAGFEVVGGDEFMYDTDYMKEAAEAIMKYFVMDGYIHEAHA